MGRWGNLSAITPQTINTRMNGIFEETGTISVTRNSTGVAGNGTTWLIGYDGIALNIAGKSYPVASVDSPTSLTLVKPYPEATATNLEYTFMPLHPTNYNLAGEVREMLEASVELNKAAVDIIETSRGPEGKPGPAGPVGPAGANGATGFGSLVNLSEHAGQLAGGSGRYLILPVNEGNPGVTLSQSASVFLPGSTPGAVGGLWVRSQVINGVSGLAITLGLTNAPEPQPEVPGEEIDLSGSSEIYGAPGTIFPLGIYVPNSGATFAITVPNGLPIKVERKTAIVVPSKSRWTLDGAGAPYAVTGDAVSLDAVMNKNGTNFDFRSGHVVVNAGSYMRSGALGLEFPNSSDPQTTQTPPSIRLGFKGVVPAGSEAILASLLEYGVGGVTLQPHWRSGVMQLAIDRNGSYEGVFSDASPARKLGTLQHYEAEWTDNPGGPGGTVRFYIDGVQIGNPVQSTSKPRITPSTPLEINAVVGNTAPGVNNLEIEHVEVSAGKPGVQASYQNVVSGPISRADLEALVVDATGLSAQPARKLSYTANGTQTYDIDVIVGEMILPAGRPYKAVLEDWSTGEGVEHPNHLIMTKPAAQNCRFEDVSLFGSQAAWTEVLPQGPVPNINGINYYCEGIRMGTYVQFQFGYDWDSSTMPAVPFGDPTGKESYMVAHKWKIYDSAGTLLARVEQPGGQPLNSAASPAVWQGTYDGRGVPIITNGNRWTPHGTVRSGVIWRSHDPVDYSQQHIWNTVPTYDIRVPFACATTYSVNGGDMRLFGDGQFNGFANYRVMSWEPTTYDGIQALATTTKSQWKCITGNPGGLTPNAGIWLKYTPFNQMGRSPTTGPGGVRDDRQIMPDMVAEYARDVTKLRPVDEFPMKRIAIDYLTGYVSDAIHAFENGRNKPLFKGNPHRPITMRNHYYGPGYAVTPASQAFYVQGGRPYEFANGYSPLRVKVPRGGTAPDKPIFGTNQIDALHAHQFPHWGSLLFQSPEFAFLGHRFTDQIRLYENVILNTPWAVDRVFERAAAWNFAHAALAWKTGSNNSSRLYSQAEILDWTVQDFEGFYDLFYATTPGFLNPPTNVKTGNAVDKAKAVFAGTARFGPCTYVDGDGVSTHDFMVGYWLSALHVAEKMGFNAALRAASPKAKAVIDWLVAIHRKRIVGRIKDGATINAPGNGDSVTAYWSTSAILAVGGDVSQLPQTFAAVDAAQTRKAPGWDTFFGTNGEILSRDGQAMDQLLAGPALMKDMGLTGSDLEQAVTLAEQRFQERLASEAARGANAAGTVWFKYHQATNNRPFKPPV